MPLVHLGRLTAGLVIAGAVAVSLLLAYILFGFGRTATAATTITVDISLNSPQATIDKNDPANAEPFVATLWGKVSNTGGETAVNVTVTLDTLTNSLALQTGQTATYTIPSLAAGSDQAFFWFVSYSRTDATAGSYTVRANASNVASEVTATSTLTSTEQISASSNKITSVTASGGGTISVGQVITVTVGFEYGQIGNTFGDAWSQPVSNASFDASILRLVSAQVTLDAVAQTADKLYFTGLGGDSPTGTVVYTFQGIAEGNTAITPYQQAASGNTRKNTGDLTTSTTVTDNAFQGTIAWR